SQRAMPDILRAAITDIHQQKAANGRLGGADVHLGVVLESLRLGANLAQEREQARQHVQVAPQVTGVENAQRGVHYALPLTMFPFRRALLDERAHALGLVLGAEQQVEVTL